MAQNSWRTVFNWESTWAQENPERRQIDLAHEVLRVLDAAQNEEEARKLINELPQNYKEFMEIPSRLKFEDHKSWIGSMRSQLLTFVGIHGKILIKRDHDSKFKAEKAAKLRELMGQKIALDERFDAHIYRLIQRLARLKTFKQVVEIQVSRARTIDQRSIADHRQ